MAVFADVIGSVVSRASGFLRGWTFQLGFAEPPTSTELTQAIDAMVEQMQGPDYPRLAKWISSNIPELNIQLLGLYRDR